MARIVVIYHSQQYGNTKMLAEALAEGVREAGTDVKLINTNERRVTLEEFLSADGVAIGTPDYFSYVAGTVKSFFDDIYLWDQSGKPVKGKPAVLFYSCGGGGKVKQPFESLAQRFFKHL
jgi:multimeric flavodoxin WrbA